MLKRTWEIKGINQSDRERIILKFLDIEKILLLRHG